MYVCLCERVTEASLLAAIAAAAGDVDGVRRSCGASAGCGGCRPVVEAILARAAVADGGSRSSRGASADATSLEDFRPYHPVTPMGAG